MRDLYRRRVTEGGRVYYERTYDWDEGDPAEGLWVIRKEGWGISRTWVREFIAPIPEITPSAAWIVARINTIADAIAKAGDDRTSTADVARLVVNSLIDEESKSRVEKTVGCV